MVVWWKVLFLNRPGIAILVIEFEPSASPHILNSIVLRYIFLTIFFRTSNEIILFYDIFLSWENSDVLRWTFGRLHQLLDSLLSCFFFHCCRFIQLLYWNDSLHLSWAHTYRKLHFFILLALQCTIECYNDKEY